MDYTAVTRLIICFIVFVVAAWDAFLMLKGHNDATFSVVLYRAAREFPVIPFVFGVLCGHIFWQVYSSRI